MIRTILILIFIALFIIGGAFFMHTDQLESAVLWCSFTGAVALCGLIDAAEKRGKKRHDTHCL